jgi:hypothetical protein
MIRTTLFALTGLCLSGPLNLRGKGIEEALVFVFFELQVHLLVFLFLLSQTEKGIFYYIAEKILN